MAKDESPDVDLGSDDTSEEEAPLEEKYREQMRQIFPQKIELPISTLPEMLKEQINLSPSFQRRDVWDIKKQARFLESIIMNVPVPSVFLGEDDYGRYVVLDGRQRLTAVSQFLANEFELRGLRVWAELNGCRFSDLKKRKLERALTRRFLPAVLILKESSPEVKYDVFDRLNTGGMVAKPMEIRNAIYRGGFSQLLHELSEYPSFLRLWNIPTGGDDRLRSRLYRRMDDLELVLRFFALKDRAEHKRSGGTFESYLNHFMGHRNRQYADEPDLKKRDRVLFQTACDCAWKIFGNDAFRKPRGNKKRSVKSAPYADALLAALADLDPETVTDQFAQSLRRELESVYSKDQEFRKSMGSGTNGRGATDYRIKTVRELVDKLGGRKR